MKKIFLPVLLTLFTMSTYSQRVYFLYLQSESEQPFYVKMNDKIHSSAAKGYLILSHLRDSSYNFVIGFPGQSSAEQKFYVEMKGKDHGYLLKNFNEKGWGLFELQTMAIIMSGSNKVENNESVIKEPMQKDASVFTQILAKASDDSSLLEKPEATKPIEKKTDLPEVEKKEAKTEVQGKQIEAAEIEKKNVLTGENKTFVTPPVEIKEEKKETLQPEKNTTQNPVDPNANASEVYKRSEIIRKSESSTSVGFGVTYIDAYAEGKSDTIQIVIPQIIEPKYEIKQDSKAEKKFLEINSDSLVENKSELSNQKTMQNAVVVPNTPININNCKVIADENDFLKIRKKMAGESEDDIMIMEARKIYKTRCFTTEQIKNLGLLFLTDEGKYKFFDASFSYVSDPEKYRLLQGELKSEYYINRFKAMLR